MTRRELIRIASSGIALASLPRSLSLAVSAPPPASSNRLFFSPSELPQIQANASTPLFAALYQDWAASAATRLQQAQKAFEQSGDMIRDFAQVVTALTETASVHLVESRAETRESLLAALNWLAEQDHWDYFLDGPANRIGIQRASMATVGALFARETLGAQIDPALDRKIMLAVAEKGCLPCYRTLYGMDHPDEVIGWRFDQRHSDYFDISMARWPEILGANNLRAAPAGALGLGALALGNSDPRAALWLSSALNSAERVLDLFAPDGSYFEGISYAGYTLRTTLNFLEAHLRQAGSIDWPAKANFQGIVDFIVSMQAGQREDGYPDIINFSDARNSVDTCVPSWIAQRTGSPLAQYAAESFSQPRGFLDFLWYRPTRPKSPPPARLKNERNDLDWVICRSGWKPDDAVLGFRSGGPANHEHADRNHILFKAYGERLLTDLFGAAYDRRHPGWILRHTAAHNSVLVDGRGQHYHQGEEGTNDSKSYANIVDFGYKGELVWWSSDASPAYLVENNRIFKVLRTILFAKPNIVIIIDQIHLKMAPQSVALRFFPDNRDGAARLSVAENRFSISRPKAALKAEIHSANPLAVRQSKLDLPEESGDFPYIEVSSPAAYHHEIVTRLSASPADGSSPEYRLAPTNDGWLLQSPQGSATIVTRHRIIPTITPA